MAMYEKKTIFPNGLVTVERKIFNNGMCVVERFARQVTPEDIADACLPTDLFAPPPPPTPPTEMEVDEDEAAPDSTGDGGTREAPDDPSVPDRQLVAVGPSPAPDGPRDAPGDLLGDIEGVGIEAPAPSEELVDETHADK
jgi:hypothetical protein